MQHFEIRTDCDGIQTRHAVRGDGYAFREDDHREWEYVETVDNLARVAQRHRVTAESYIARARAGLAAAHELAEMGRRDAAHARLADAAKSRRSAQNHLGLACIYSRRCAKLALVSLGEAA